MGILYQGNKQILGGGAGSLTELGVIASAYELNYVDGVTSNIQTQLNDKASISDIEDIAFVGDEEAIDATIPLNASTLGGKTESMLSVAKAVDSDTLGGKTEDMLSVANASTLGGKAPEYYIQPRNLLDNSDFRNPVNQRGVTSGTQVSAWHYFLDRWTATGEAITPNWNKAGLTVPAGEIAQYMDSLTPYIGKKMTVACGFSDGVVLVASGECVHPGSWVLIAQAETDDGRAIDFSAATSAGKWAVSINSAGATVEWAALYEGEFTVETLPPYVPKGYTVELSECRRYFRRYAVWQEMILGYVAWDNKPRIVFLGEPAMRVTPTASRLVASLNCGGTIYYIDETPEGGVANREGSLTLFLGELSDTNNTRTALGGYLTDIEFTLSADL